MKPFENRKSKTASGDWLKERAGPVDRIQRTEKNRKPDDRKNDQMTEKAKNHKYK